MRRLGKRAVFSQDDLARADKTVAQVPYGDEVIAAVAVLMAGRLDLTAEQIASVLGVSKPTVVRMYERFRCPPEDDAASWGGDRRSVLPADARREVLAQLEADAAAGKIVVVEQVKAAIEEACGSSVSLQTAYNILHREGWRKVRPDKVHPKGDAEKQLQFKKKHSRKQWTWLPPLPKPPASSCG